MSLSLRLFFVYCAFIALCAYFITVTVSDEIKPGVRQSTEETLVDTANLLAEILKTPLLNNQLTSGEYAKIVNTYGQRQLNASIWGFAKERVNHRVYVTNNQGIVLLDSHNLAVGQDYSQWNDVYRTLNGQYGARSSTETVGNIASTVMYVAAPITDNGKIIGVVSVAKPNSSVQPFINRSKNRLIGFGAIVAIVGLIVGALFSWWLGKELGHLRKYALTVSQGKRAEITPNALHSKEFQQLAQALNSMRNELDGKAYVEQYVQTFAHEFKSPLAGIRAAVELLQGPIAQNKQQQFLQNIDHESTRLEQLIAKLLQLAAIEHQQAPIAPAAIAIKPMVSSLIHTHTARINLKQITIHTEVPNTLQVTAEQFLIQQALNNLLDNAIGYTPKGGTIRLLANATDGGTVISLQNTGPHIPEYALARLTERFFSLPRPDNGQKSTGLGLSFVAEVAALHGGELRITNVENGVRCTLLLP